MKTSLYIGEYLIQRLYAHGVRHVFGIPGDYVLGFYDLLSQSKLSGSFVHSDANGRILTLRLVGSRGQAKPDSVLEIAAALGGERR